MFNLAFFSKKKLFIFLFVFVVLFFYLSSLFQSYQRLQTAEDRLSKAVEEKEELEREKQELLLELESTSTNEFKEYLAREKLGLVKEGEYVVILPENEILRRLSPRKVNLEDLKLPPPNWRKWTDKIFGV